MPKTFLSDDEVYIVDADIAKGNIGRKVRLVKWVEAGETYRQGGMEFLGGEEGAWIVTAAEPGFGLALLRCNEDDTLEGSQVAMCKAGHLSATPPPSPIRKRTKSA